MAITVKKSVLEKKHSFITIVSMTMAFFAVILFALLFFIVASTNHAMEKSSADLLKQTVDLDIRTLQQMMSSNDSAIAALLQQGEYLQRISDNSEIQRSTSSQQVLNVMQNVSYGNGDVYILVVYSLEYDVYLAHINGINLSYTKSENIKSIISQKAAEKKESGKWQYWETGEEGYFVRPYFVNGCWIGALIPVNTWITQVKEEESGISYLVHEADQKIAAFGAERVLSEDETAGLSATEEPQWTEDDRYFYYAETEGPVSLTAYLPRSAVLLNYQKQQIIIIGLSVLAVFFVLFCTAYLRREVLLPTYRLIAGMKRISNGEYAYRFQSENNNREFSELTTSFNNMLDVIVNLRMKAYEERLQFNEATLKYVQLQIRPHFFLNALTTIHSMTYQSREDDIREYIECLSRNVRYLFRAGLHTLPLSEEIEHVRDYIRMQNMQYPDCVFDYIEIDPAVKEHPVPQLLIHTMIENIYKHSVSLEKLTCILIHAKEEVKGTEVMCHISVEDDGFGYPPEFLEHFKEDQIRPDKDGHGIGLWNVKKTLSLMYRREDLIEFSNKDPHGARIDIWIPRRAKRQSTVWKL